MPRKTRKTTSEPQHKRAKQRGSAAPPTNQSQRRSSPTSDWLHEFVRASKRRGTTVPVCEFTEGFLAGAGDDDVPLPPELQSLIEEVGKLNRARKFAKASLRAVAFLNLKRGAIGLAIGPNRVEMSDADVNARFELFMNSVKDCAGSMKTLYKQGELGNNGVIPGSGPNPLPPVEGPPMRKGLASPGVDATKSGSRGGGNKVEIPPGPDLPLNTITSSEHRGIFTDYCSGRSSSTKKGSFMLEGSQLKRRRVHFDDSMKAELVSAILHGDDEISIQVEEDMTPQGVRLVLRAVTAQSLQRDLDLRCRCCGGSGSISSI